MRRLLLLALLAPALAAAQTAPDPTPGQITFPNVVNSDRDGFINEPECLGTGTATISLSWEVSAVTTGTVGSYQLYAYSPTTDHPADPAIIGTACPTASEPVNSFFAGAVGSTVLASTTTKDFSLRDIAVAAGKGTCRFDVAEDVALCVQGFTGTQGAGGGTRIGAARGKLSIVTAKPAAPDGLSASPGDQALNVGFSAGDDSTSFEIMAEPIGTVTSGATRRTSGRITTKSFRLDGLVNDQPYRVWVAGFTDADNVSTSAQVTGTPLPVNDFYDVYRAAGGVEQGGCAGGPAGPLAVLGAAAALASLRRRKK